MEERKERLLHKHTHSLSLCLSLCLSLPLPLPQCASTHEDFERVLVMPRRVEEVAERSVQKLCAGRVKLQPPAGNQEEEEWGGEGCAGGESVWGNLNSTADTQTHTDTLRHTQTHSDTLTHSLTHSPTHSPTHSLTNTHTHSHPLTHSRMCKPGSRPACLQSQL